MNTTNPAENLSIKRFNEVIFDIVTVEKYILKNDGVSCPGYPIYINYTYNSYLNHYKDLKFVYKYYAGGQLISPIKTYDKTKTNYPIKIVDVRFQNIK